MISKAGNQDDIAHLVRIGKEGHGKVSARAASAAMRLSPKPLETARELMQSNSSEIQTIAFTWMFAQNSEEVRRVFEDLLDNSDDTNRMRGLYYVFNRMSSKELEQFLTEYIAKESYYYNVVTWLDRLLYSPARFRDMFVDQLEKVVK